MDVKAFLLNKNEQTYNKYYDGKMSYALHGKSWEGYVSTHFPDIDSQFTSENVFKGVIDLFAENLIPTQTELKGFSNTAVPLLMRGHAPVVLDPGRLAHFPEHYEMISDGTVSIAAIFTRSLNTMQDFVTYIWSDGTAELWAKDVPADLSTPTRQGYKFVERTTGNKLYRFALNDKGMGRSLAALQDRINHSIIDQTVIAEMYARPFWYLLNVAIPPNNPFLPEELQPSNDSMKEHDSKGASGRIFTTSGEGPFGQLDPPTIGDMITYHDSLIRKVSQSTGIPEYYFKPGSTGLPSGTALRLISKRFNNRISRIRDDIEDNLLQLATDLGVQKEEGATELTLWDSSDDMLQETLDAHGLSLTTMGYPLKYVAEVVTPGVDLDDYMDDGFEQSQQLTPDQVAAYAANPGGQAAESNVNPLHPSTGLRPVE